MRSLTQNSNFSLLRGVAAFFNTLLVSISLVNSGCSRPGTSPSESRQTSPIAKEELVVFSYQEYFAPEVLQRFEAATGIRVRYESFEVVGEMRARLESNPGQFDLVVADQASCMNLLELQLIRPFDEESLTTLDWIDPRFRDCIPNCQERVFVPYLWGSTIVAFRADKLVLEAEERSWSIFWDARVRGRALLSSESFDLVSLALNSLGLPMQSRNPSHHVQAMEHLRRAVLQNDLELGDSWSNLKRLDAGEIWLTHCYSGDAAMFAADNENIHYFMPKEGAELWVDGFMLVRDSNRDDNAHRFVNFMLQPEIAAVSANHTRYLTPNRAAHSMIDPSLASDETLNPPLDMIDRCSLFVPADIERLPDLRAGVLEIQKAVKAKRRLQSSDAHEPVVSESVLD